MKKFTLLGAILLFCSLIVSVRAQEVDYSTNTSTELFDFTPWNNEALLRLFAEVHKQGRTYPTKAELEAAGFTIDLEFSRSHVRPATIMEDSAKNLVSNEDGVYPYRRLWMNIPTGQGKEIGGYPSAEFHNDVYSMWQYTHLFGAWNHSILQAPGSWADAAHKNGTHMFSGIKFFESWNPDSNSTDWVNLITSKNEDGTFCYVDPLLNALRYMGLDGINYNFEDEGYKEADVVDFHRALYKRAEEIGFNSFHIGMYVDNVTLLSEYNIPYCFGTSETGKVADVMMDYSGSAFSYTMDYSSDAAIEAMGTTEGLYAGVWISNLTSRGWDRLNKNERAKMCGLALWGEHSISRLFQYTIGTSLMDLQTNYQILLERFFSGGYQTPLTRPDLGNGSTQWPFQVSNEEGIDAQLPNFPGIASYIPERTAIQGKLPFNTHFTLGNGDFYAYKGKKTLGSWYNMGQQDYVPTYRWLYYQPNTKTPSTHLEASFTHEDAYIGGSALRLTSASTESGTDLVLYRAKLTVSGGNAKAKVALKSGKEGSNASNLSVILKKLDHDTWYEFPLGNVEGKSWQEQEVALSGFAQGDVIEYIGFRVKGGLSDYNMLVGKLMLFDDRDSLLPAGIDASSLLAEVKSETTSSMSVKLTWEVDASSFNPPLSQWNMIYNDEVNIDHFEIFYKNGEEGRVSEVGRTSTWSAFVGNIPFADESDEPYVGVRSVSVDMKTHSPIVWVSINRASSDLSVPVQSQYPLTYINPLSEGYEIALEERYISSLTTTGAIQDINYTRNTPVGDDNYIFAEDHVLKVEQGQQVSVNFRGALSDDGMQYCFGKAYLDWDINYEFDAESDEKLLEIGGLNRGITNGGYAKQDYSDFINDGYTFTIQVPEDAAIGTTRLRMVFSDAWFSHPGPAGGTAKGFSIDFPVQVSGTNASREPATDYREFRDQGIADEPDDLIGTGMEDIVVDRSISHASFYPSVAESEIFFNGVDKAWIYTIDGRFVKFVGGNPKSVGITDLIPGMYVVKMQQGQVLRSQKLMKK